MDLNDTLHGISTKILTTASPLNQIFGTGFYFNRLAPKDDKGAQLRDSQGVQRRRVESVWLVTNRHVLIPRSGEKEIEPASVTFHLRKFSESGLLEWDSVRLSSDDLESLARFHSEKSVDVAAIDISELLHERIKNTDQYGMYYGVSSEQFSGKNNIHVEVASDVLVVGYPRGFYDEVNLFPIVKSGIVASRWGAKFQGQPYFLIDAKLFPGSSGSVVLSKPIDVVVKDGQMMYSKEKQFTFLGIYSGEPQMHEVPMELDDLTIIRKYSFNLGVVWYAELVDETIDKGVPLSKALTQ